MAALALAGVDRAAVERFGLGLKEPYERSDRISVSGVVTYATGRPLGIHGLPMMIMSLRSVRSSRSGQPQRFQVALQFRLFADVLSLLHDCLIRHGDQFQIDDYVRVLRQRPLRRMEVSTFACERQAE